jgi:hypothetical protein
MGERRVIWGSFPLPDDDEVFTAHAKILERRKEKATAEGTNEEGTSHYDRTNEILRQCPGLVKAMRDLSESFAGSVGVPEAAEHWLTGATTLLEILGTISLNRTFEDLTRMLGEDGMS